MFSRSHYLHTHPYSGAPVVPCTATALAVATPTAPRSHPCFGQQESDGSESIFCPIDMEETTEWTTLVCGCKISNVAWVRHVQFGA
jgi:hypothetical protein|eukprot:SAG25_NODE_562_length_6909_cov_2.841557_7_plen_86_part_00